MIKVGRYCHLSSLAPACDDTPDSHDADIPRPVLLAPDMTHETPVASLNEESRRKQQPYTCYFIQHLVRFTMSTVPFGLSLAAAILSGGVGIPLVAVTGTAMIIAAGDACCALYNLIQVRNDRAPLSTGNDSITQVVKMLMTNCGLSDSCAESVGDVASFTLRIGIAITSLFLPSGSPVECTAHMLSRISAGITMSLTIIGGGIDMCIARVERMSEDEEDEENGKLSPEEIQRMVDPVVACYERYRAQLHTATVGPAW